MTAIIVLAKRKHLLKTNLVADQEALIDFFL